MAASTHSGPGVGIGTSHSLQLHIDAQCGRWPWRRKSDRESRKRTLPEWLHFSCLRPPTLGPLRVGDRLFRTHSGRFENRYFLSLTPPISPARGACLIRYRQGQCRCISRPALSMLRWIIRSWRSRLRDGPDSANLVPPPRLARRRIVPPALGGCPTRGHGSRSAAHPHRSAH